MCANETERSERFLSFFTFYSSTAIRLVLPHSDSLAGVSASDGDARDSSDRHSIPCTQVHDILIRNFYISLYSPGTAIPLSQESSQDRDAWPILDLDASSSVWRDADGCAMGLMRHGRWDHTADRRQRFSSAQAAAPPPPPPGGVSRSATDGSRTGTRDGRRGATRHPWPCGVFYSLSLSIGLPIGVLEGGGG